MEQGKNADTARRGVYGDRPKALGLFVFRLGGKGRNRVSVATGRNYSFLEIVTRREEQLQQSRWSEFMEQAVSRHIRKLPPGEKREQA